MAKKISAKKSRGVGNKKLLNYNFERSYRIYQEKYKEMIDKGYKMEEQLSRGEFEQVVEQARLKGVPNVVRDLTRSQRYYTKPTARRISKALAEHGYYSREGLQEGQQGPGRLMTLQEINEFKGFGKGGLGAWLYEELHYSHDQIDKFFGY